MIRTRFAPSPTGYLHIGGVRTALFNWLFARQQGGQFILRIDDTDQKRNVDEALQPILDGFRWLGMDWDEGPEVDGPYAPYYQSQRGDRYQAAVDQLLASGHAYRDYATAEELDAEREAHKAGKPRDPYLYSRRWMAESDEQAAAWEAEGRQASVRLKMPREGLCELPDLVRGDVQFAWNKEQDHRIQRADGTFLYHLATVVDDHDFAISHVIRSEEHLSNTPRQVFIAQSLGYPIPQFAHLPYVAEPGSKSKLSKRKISNYLKHREFKKVFDHGEAIARRCGRSVDAETFNPVLVDFYRDVGYLPDAVLNYLLLLGWSLDDHTEDFSREQMLELFTLQRVNKAPASFDPPKLLAFQERYFQRLPVKQQVARCVPFLQAAGLAGDPPDCDLGPQVKAILEAGAGERMKVAGDILDYDYFFVPDDRLRYDEKAFAKRILKGDAVELLGDYRDRLSELATFDADTLKHSLEQFCEDKGIKIGQIIHAVRVATSGVAVGFGTFETLEILGSERCLARIEQTLQRARAETSPQ